MDLTIERFDLDPRVREPNTRRPTPAGTAIPTDFPFIVDDDTQEVIEPLALHLLAKFNAPGAYRGTVWTKVNSANAAAADLKAWWTYLSGHPAAASWDQVPDRVLAAYLNALQSNPSEKTRDFLSSGTIVRHCASIDSFNDYARARWPSGTFPSMGAAKVLAGLNTSRGKHSSDETPRPLTSAEVQSVNTALGPLPSRRGRGHSSRSRLAFAIVVQVGLRIDEIVNLRAGTFERIEIAPERRMKATRLRITKTKGLVPREVYFPNWLILEIQRYIGQEREESLARGRLLWIKQPSDEPPYLLLNKPEARGRNAGKEATPESIEEDFAKAIRDLGMVGPRPILVGTAEETDVTVPLHVFHDGRHTFAHWTFEGLLKQGRRVDAAWLLLRNRLGHKNVRTTVDTYLRSFSEVDETAIDLLVEHLAALAAEADA